MTVAGVLVVSGILLAANLGEKSYDWTGVSYALYLALCGGVFALYSLAAAGYLIQAAADPSRQASARAFLGAALGALSGLLAAGALLPPLRRALSRLLPGVRAASPVHAVAGGLYVLVLLQQVAQQVSFDQVQAFSQIKQGPSLLFIVGTNQLPMVVVSLAGVGFIVRRRAGDTLQRLGLYWPGLRWVVASIALAGGLLLFSHFFELGMSRLVPGQTQALQKVQTQLLGNLHGVGQLAGLALAAGIGEEILFRGALLPRFGNLSAAVLFAALHTQYGFTFATVEIFVIGMMLGLLRPRAGTTGCILAHAGYDLIAVLTP